LTVDIAVLAEANWVVVDGYHFGAEYQQVIKNAGLEMLFVDDNGHADHYYADVVLNQNIHADPSLYANREPYTALLLGTDYILLRREFLKWKQWEREIPEVAKKILVTMGGSDPDDVTSVVIRALQNIEIEGFEAKVVVGANNPHYAKLQYEVSQLSASVQLINDSHDMPGLMRWADLAISSGGTTCWELAFMGLPALVLVIADNQKASVEELRQAGTFVCLDNDVLYRENAIAHHLRWMMSSRKLRERLYRTSTRLVDGNGVFRVIERISTRGTVEARYDFIARHQSDGQREAAQLAE
jgi:UDP-2,4-diacetamido-2,4,6-trideoxy-beta-L-altropyranose hydrolase